MYEAEKDNINKNSGSSHQTLKKTNSSGDITD
jgi:hypothetical protein